MVYERIEEFIRRLPTQARIVGFDYGTKRIGFAISDPLQTIAIPSGTITYQAEQEAITKIISIIKDYNTNAIMFGLPYQMDGTEGEACYKVREFVKNLEENNNLNILLYDERLSSSAAYTLLSHTDLNRKKKDDLNDKLAASFVLQGVLDNIANVRKGLVAEVI
jgi:putative Holliday junction resolvase